MKPTPYPGTQAVQRAMRLLRAVAAARADVGVVELARGAGLHKATAFRLLSALESAEMVQRGHSGDGYRLGPELLRLASQALGSDGLQAAAAPTLQALASETRETVTLEVLVGHEVLILDEVVGSHMIGAMPSRGTRWPAHATSTGKVLLAALPAGELADHLPSRLSSHTQRTVTEAAALRRELGRVRARGHAIALEELEPGFVAVGAPVHGADGAVVAAISVGGPRTRLAPARLQAIGLRLPAAAAAISERLGWRPRDRAAVAR
jgi:IclR family acetate operon transcriptional repressor